MTSLPPPRGATWLFRRLVSGPHQEALLGDLLEQYQRGHSAVWYWRQVATAILGGAVRDGRDHVALALRAMLVWFILATLMAQLALIAYDSVGIGLWNWSVDHDWDTARLLWFGRPRWTSPPLLLMACVNASMIGWVVARLHRDHVAAALFSCLLIQVCWLTLNRWLSPGVSYGPVLMAPMPPFYAVIPSVITLVIVPIAFLVGGLIGSTASDEEGRLPTL